MDNETYGERNVYDYGARIYNPRLGRFLSVDPLSKNYAGLTTYQFASNMPVWAIDLDGMEAWVATQKWSPQIVEKYRLYVQAEIKSMIQKADAGQVNKNTVFDCADLAVHLLVGFASENNLPVTFTLADGQVVTNETPSVLLTLSDGTQKTVELNSGNFEDVVRNFSNSTSLQKDMTDMPHGYKPQAGDLSNSGGHVNVVRSQEKLISTDVGNAPGFTQTVSGTTGSTASPAGGTLTGVPLKNDRLHVVSPEEPMTWSMWSIMVPPPPPPGAGTGMQTLPQDNARVVTPPIQPVTPTQ